jgi:hypothetical protein
VRGNSGKDLVQRHGEAIRQKDGTGPATKKKTADGSIDQSSFSLVVRFARVAIAAFAVCSLRRKKSQAANTTVAKGKGKTRKLNFHPLGVWRSLSPTFPEQLISRTGALG